MFEALATGQLIADPMQSKHTTLYLSPPRLLYVDSEGFCLVINLNFVFFVSLRWDKSF